MFSSVTGYILLIFTKRGKEMTESNQEAKEFQNNEENNVADEAVSPARVAVVQFDPQVGIKNQDRNLRHGLDMANTAVQNGANLIVS